MSEAGGDVGGTGQAEQADRGVAEGGHYLGAGSGADLGPVLVESHVPDPVGAVLDAPVSLDPGGQDAGWCGAVVGGGDHVDDLDGLLTCPRGGAPDLRYLGRAGEGDPGRCGHGLDRPVDAAAVTGLDGGVGGHVAPGQVLARRVEVRLVGLDGEHVVTAGGGDQPGGVGLGVHRIDGHHDTPSAARSNAASSVRTAGISLLFAAVANCPRMVPVAWSKAATRCGAAVVALRAPRTVLPSMARTR